MDHGTCPGYVFQVVVSGSLVDFPIAEALFYHESFDRWRVYSCKILVRILHTSLLVEYLQILHGWGDPRTPDA